MACFIVPAAEAVVVKVVEKVAKSKEEKLVAEGKDPAIEKPVRVPIARKLKWLSYMLFGGAVLLLFEHVWHGEITAWFPFLTAMSSPEETSQMLHEMATVGVTMAVLITVVWGAMCLVADHLVRRSSQKEEEKA